MEGSSYLWKSFVGRDHEKNGEFTMWSVNSEREPLTVSIGQVAAPSLPAVSETAS